MRQPKKHFILYPLSLVYGLITGFRNWLFDQDLLKSTEYRFPLISVGNLAVGGTGKTPHTEFILRILQNEWTIAVLSRGYKRNTKGFHLADATSTSLTLGDESFQIHQKFPNVTVAVDEKRVHGIEQLQSHITNLQVIVLDDAFQHRYVVPGLSILLTDYSNLYCHDLMLPAGQLREWKSGSTRANIIVVTKCPPNINPMEMRVVELELNIAPNQLVFFSCLQYEEFVPVFPEFISKEVTLSEIKEKKASTLLVAGIVSPESIVDYLKPNFSEVETLFFDDHHPFRKKDFNAISKRFEALTCTEKILLVTEKDAARLVSNPLFPEHLKQYTYALPIRVRILHNQEDQFIKKIRNYVRENSRNR